MSSKTPWRILWRLKGECPLSVERRSWNFADSLFNVYTCQSWRPNSYTLHKGRKNVLEDSLEDYQETHRRMSSSSEPKGIEFPYCLYISFLTSNFIQTPLRNEECPPKLFGCCFVGESHLPVHQGAWNFEKNFLKVLDVILDSGIHSLLNSIRELRMSLEDAKI